MPAGCDFICKNKQCSAYNSGFTITAPWPMTRIEILISKLNALTDSHKEYKKKLIELKREGKKLACVVYPNIDSMPCYGYRVQLWSKDALCVWSYDVEAEPNEKAYEAISRATIIPEFCPKTNCKLLSFNEVLKESIECPHCREKLTESRWFAKEY